MNPFGIGRRPTAQAEWTSARVKDIAPYVNRGIAPVYSDDETGFVAISQKCVPPAGAVDPTLGRPMTAISNDAPDILRVGDILVNSTGTGTLGRAALVVADPGVVAVADGHVTIVRVDRAVIEPRFLAYVLSTRAFYDVANIALAVGSTNQTELGRDAIRTLGLAYPSLRDQRRISAFLDDETRRIDELVHEQDHMQRLLEERYWSGVASAIASDEHPRVALRRVLISITDGPFGSALTSAHYVDDGIRVVRLGNIGLDEFLDADQAFIDIDREEELIRHRVLPGDLLIAGLGDVNHHVGRACVAPDGMGPAIVKADCYCGRVDRTRAVPEYLALVLSSPWGMGAVHLLSRGSTRARINLEIAKSVKLPLPDVSSQRALVDHFCQERKKVRLAIRDMDRMKLQLQEHREAVVTAAVTGQLLLTTSAA